MYCISCGGTDLHIAFVNALNRWVTRGFAYGSLVDALKGKLTAYRLGEYVETLALDEPH